METKEQQIREGIRNFVKSIIEQEMYCCKCDYCKFHCTRRKK